MDHSDGDGGGSQGLEGVGAEEQPAEAAAPTGSDDEEVGLLGLLDERRGRGSPSTDTAVKVTLG